MICRGGHYLGNAWQPGKQATVLHEAANLVNSQTKDSPVQQIDKSEINQRFLIPKRILAKVRLNG